VEATGTQAQSCAFFISDIAGSEKSSDDKERSSHIKPLCKALYNSLFNQVVSACHASLVIVWNLETGEKVIQFSNAHPDSEITAMCFDQSLRRLVTGMEEIFHDRTSVYWFIHWFILFPS
jgi:WD40 repeat protein